MLLPETLKLHDKTQFEFHYIYFLPWKDQMVTEIQREGGTITCLKANDNFQLMTKVWSLVKYIRLNKIQLIHAHLPWAGILARVAGKLTGVPVIYTEHNKQERYHWATRLMNLGTLNLLSKIIAVSADVEGSIHKYKPRLSTSVRTIVNGVNIQKFDRHSFNGHEVRKRFNIPADAPLIGTIAVFRFQKRLDLWMELALEILKEVKEAHFIIVGDGPLKNELLKQRDAFGLQNRVHMPGLETEVRPYLAAFDLYMMSSIFEGLPLALLEAMAMECPVVTTDAGGIKEVVRHEKDGFLCSVDEPRKLIEYACTLLKDKGLQKTFGAHARLRVTQSFSMEKMVSELEEEYKNCLDHNP
ncbi:MAG: glycosyl transferase family 1 [Marivirga sp.]|nr:glycosyl transferase family 1 [Marivirga sp.]